MRKVAWWLPWLLMWAGAPALAVVPPAWKHTAYAYDAKQADVATTLEDFAREFGIGLEMGPLDGVVDGRIRAASPQAFLDRLGQEHHFQWFVYNETLYVSPTDQQTSARIEVSQDAADDLKSALTDVGLLDPRFGWGALPDEGVVLVSGPPRYVEMIREYSRKVDTPDEKQDVVVLPLRYANAADRTIRYRDQQLTVAGVATILQDLLESRARGDTVNAANLLQGAGLGGGQGSNPYGASSTLLGGLDNDSLQQGLDRVLANTTAGAKNSHGGTPGGSKSRIRVSADVRNNAVLIYDLPKRKALYQELVKQLDQPRNLIEIDAVILDINRDDLAELSSSWNVWAGGTNVSGSLLDSGATLSAENSGRFALAVHALEARGAATVVGNPSILTLENQPAVIDFSRTEYITATGERVADIQPITAGTSLQVIPRSLNGNGKSQVQLILDIEDGQIDQSVLNVTQPSVRKGNVSTQAIVAERGSLVVGGFHGLESNDKISRIPWLSDIPVIGKVLFTSTSHRTTKRERLFILTPRLIGDQVDPARYVENGNPDDIDAAGQRIDKRRSEAQPTRIQVQNTFTQLLDGLQPSGFSSGGALPFVPDSLCDSGGGLVIDRQRAQWYGHKTWGVAVVVARNTGTQPVRVDESGCGGRWVLGVAAWPHAWLQPGEESEVFIALRQPRAAQGNAQARASLLKGAKP
ncbi:EscC/YscC/HrcC family type III secretion system outer membrane ring protein [Pseudomonas gingeri NCPPB 3146 = LMG 5327]|uniref:Type 3 secretion system secretin n=3 Tax=Pseudomonas gingeri TaxID=117681 RepID=A0A7Y8CGF4_9PSED|nr:type III secretion system outer membrane ring subunit SctC [Pseudomonas gingeri]NVZ28568.1 type III secretion system outer membrane ring subunit SctC [Pseudomonas gingeri]NVZ62666.1 type III secretion system outer membrane ring subunit SctC [Pseudomonas gingeri]NVZ76491.1 type III secretion system outer membrane ring subunit SctC [Pseudomonas gingeri]NWA08366.1 type III secretion system outer membrane ring subunit SctC [Pseudomonas gingeri]NWC18175.1 type III secretion system outer membrane